MPRACISCGYELAEATPNTNCPECGRVVSDEDRSLTKAELVRQSRAAYYSIEVCGLVCLVVAAPDVMFAIGIEAPVWTISWYILEWIPGVDKYFVIPAMVLVSWTVRVRRLSGGTSKLAVLLLGLSLAAHATTDIVLLALDLGPDECAVGESTGFVLMFGACYFVARDIRVFGDFLTDKMIFKTAEYFMIACVVCAALSCLGMVVPRHLFPLFASCIGGTGLFMVAIARRLAHRARMLSG